MTIRGRHQNTAEQRSRETSDGNRDMDEQDSIDQDSSPSKNHPPAHRDHPGPSTVYREMSVHNSSDGGYDDLQNRQRSIGLCQLIEAFVNFLLIFCACASHNLASLGALYHYYGSNVFNAFTETYVPFTGTDADKVMEVDQLMNQLKQPAYMVIMGYGGVLIIYACVMLALGFFSVPYHWPPVLLGEALLNILIALGYIPALAFYFIKLQETYNTAICKDREELYKRKGRQGFGCQFNGADIAGGLFGVLGVIVFTIGAVLAIRAFRSVRELESQRAAEDNNL